MWCLDECGGAYIANKDDVVCANQASRELMQGISPAIQDFRMDRAHTILLIRALRDRELRLKTAIELGSGLFLPGARGNQILQPQVNAYVAPR
jgi:hypothetical protein